MRRVCAIGWIVLAGCGRLAFDPQHDAAAGDGPGSVVVTFGESGTATFGNVTTDTYLTMGGGGMLNYGGATFVESDIGGGVATPILLRFDVAALPIGTAILSIELQLEIIDASMDGSIEVFRMLESWSEGDQDTMPGVASWNDRHVGIAWSMSGARGSSRDTTPIGAATGLASTGPLRVELDVQAVQAWVDNAAANAGVAIVI